MKIILINTTGFIGVFKMQDTIHFQYKGMPIEALGIFRDDEWVIEDAWICDDKNKVRLSVEFIDELNENSDYIREGLRA